MTLGRGLESLIPNKSGAFSRPAKKVQKPQKPLDPSTGLRTGKAQGKRDNIFYIEVDKIKPNPNQPRQVFEEESLKFLADSVSRHGILQPLIVWKQEIKKDHGRTVEYHIIAGERRWRAAKLAGFRQVPVIIREAEEQDRLELSLVENIQRTDLSPIEEAKAYQRLVNDFSLTQGDIAERVNRSREVVANKLRLLSLPYEVQKSLATGDISEGHAKVLLSLKNPEKQIFLADQVSKKNWSVRALEEHVRIETQPRQPQSTKLPDPELTEYQKTVQDTLGIPVSISGNKQKGRLAISFFSSEELENIIKKLTS